MSTISDALTALFQKHRIVFWYNSEPDIRGEFEAITLEKVEKIEISNHEFGIKYQIIKEAPDHKFLLYSESSQPPDLENWLLDVQLANTTFNADQVSLWATEIGLPIDLLEVVKAHEGFFRKEEWRVELKNLLKGDENSNGLSLKMLAVCADVIEDVRLENILLSLLDELSKNRDQKHQAIVSANLDQFLWEKVGQQFGYRSTNPSPLDFAMDLFKSSYQLSLSEHAELNKDALIFLKSWKDSHSFRRCFAEISNKVAGLLDIEIDVRGRDFHALMNTDYFKVIDQKILTDLCEQVANQTISTTECEKIIWQRRRTFWFSDFDEIYEALLNASRFLSLLNQSELAVKSFQDGVKKYKDTWHRLDSYYRKFTYFAHESNQAGLLKTIKDKVDRYYSNNFLLILNDHFQQWIDTIESWDPSPFLLQRHFFESHIKPYVDSQTKVAVVISDALRYESGVELNEMIEKEDRYQPELDAMVSMLPSYTQLGMAALLPNTVISWVPDGVVQVDGIPTQGLENRNKVLKKMLGPAAIAIQSKELMEMGKDESRDLVKANKVIYVFHNLIDAIGDKTESEHRVFTAVENTLQELVDIVKKLFNANISNVVVTSDHGFLYQDHLVDESEYTVEDVQGEEIFFRARRFVVGKNLKQNLSVKTFSSNNLGVDGDFELQVPKSIKRLRLKGSGIRYVHGGASLQEILIPVIKVVKKRISDVSQVDVSILTSQSSVITTGQISIKLYQQEPISSEKQPRELVAGIYSDNDTLISDEHKIVFDLASENAGDREKEIRFLLSQKAGEFNNQIVYVKLKEKIPTTAKYRDYRTASFQLKRSLSADFDF